MSHSVCSHLGIFDNSIQDIITGDEILSDSYDIKEVDGAVYEADCTKITIGNDNIGMLELRVVGKESKD